MYERSMKILISAAIAGFIAVFIIALMILIRYSQSPKDGDSSSAADIGAVTTVTTTTTAETTTTTAPETTTTTTTTTAAAQVTYTFRTKKQYDGHYEKHGKEFGDITKEQYLQKANDLINNTSDTVLHKTEAEDGDYIFYDTVNNEILFLSTDGYIRTYFKPNKGIEYYNKQ
ncbi:MAG: hypothetical protein IKR76_08660 [Ruminococcus sp.]|nr:hypothetical protein [Ruminococcus sp.]